MAGKLERGEKPNYYRRAVLMSNYTNNTANGNPYANVPDELKGVVRWVTWRYVIREDKETKVPFDPRTGYEASSTDPTTWGTLDEAIGHKIKAGTDGIGFVLGDGYAGIDFDEFVDPETGEIRDDAKNFIDLAGSYTEFSPSGTGVHILGYAKKPGGDSKKKFPDGSEIEIYDGKRYFTFTGNHVSSTPKTLRPIQTPLERLYFELFRTPEHEAKEAVAGPGNDLSDEEIIGKAARSRLGEKFERLMVGDTSEHNGDDSAADQALVNYLALFTDGDPEKMDRIFRRSGLMRPKWDKRHYGDGRTYGQGTIDKALAWYAEKTEAPPEAWKIEEGKPPWDKKTLPGKTSLVEVVEGGVAEPAQLIDGILYEGNTHNWYGEPGCGKTFLALWVCQELLYRGDNVVYLDEEGTSRLIAERLTSTGVRKEILPRFHYYQRPGLTSKDVDALIGTVEADDLVLVVFDSLIDYLVLDGKNENDPSEVQEWVKALCDPLKARGITVLLLDHVGKDTAKGPRGASSKKGAVDAQASVTKKNDFNRDTMGELILSYKGAHRKDREAFLSETTSFAIGGDRCGNFWVVRDSDITYLDPIAELNLKQHKALEALSDVPISFTEWLQRSGVSRSSLDRYAKAFLANGLIHKGDDGYYKSQKCHGTPNGTSGSVTSPTTLRGGTWDSSETDTKTRVPTYVIKEFTPRVEDAARQLKTFDVDDILDELGLELNSGYLSMVSKILANLEAAGKVARDKGGWTYVPLVEGEAA